MPGSLDSCINSIYEDGSIPASAGQTPTRVYIGTIIDPDDYDPDSVVYSHDFSKFYNSFYQGLF